ncbi:hypothetical protein [Nocardioides mangrovicus]|uniref:hypothetical protein n=1 Tax=Nocardioides mangrovicus TaxID=2478913 RepID=UPI0011C44C6A|nr:hypothetical protein [Nocardioides mangrovicus]
MGIFSGPAEPVDQVPLQKHVVSDKDLKGAKKALARNQAVINSDLSSSGEGLLLLAVGPVNGSMTTGVLAVTNQSVASYVKGKCDKRYDLSEVHSTKLMTRPTGTMLAYIHTFKSELDFSRSDVMRFGHIISIEVGTPRPAQAICSVIDGVTGRA